MHCGRSYYGLTAAGYRIPFKPLMTLMQLFQRRCGQHKSPRRPATAAPPPRHPATWGGAASLHGIHGLAAGRSRDPGFPTKKGAPLPA